MFHCFKTNRTGTDSRRLTLTLDSKTLDLRDWLRSQSAWLTLMCVKPCHPEGFNGIWLLDRSESVRFFLSSLIQQDKFDKFISPDEGLFERNM